MTIYFPENLKRLRNVNSITQEMIPELIGIQRTTWSNYENGRSVPSLRDFLKICKYFKISETEIIHTQLNKTKMELPINKIPADNLMLVIELLKINKRDFGEKFDESIGDLKDYEDYKKPVPIRLIKNVCKTFDLLENVFINNDLQRLHEVENISMDKYNSRFIGLIKIKQSEKNKAVSNDGDLS